MVRVETMLIVKQEGRSSLSERTIINHRNVEKSRLRGGNADPGWKIRGRVVVNLGCHERETEAWNKMPFVSFCRKQGLP